MAEPIMPAYIGIVDAGMVKQIMELMARADYYFEQHKKRWEKRYKKPYPDEDGEIGIFEGVRWINA